MLWYEYGKISHGHMNAYREQYGTRVHVIYCNYPAEAHIFFKPDD